MRYESEWNFMNYIFYFSGAFIAMFLILGLAISSISSCNGYNGIHAFDQNAVYLEGEACTVNLEDSISEEYARTMFDTCLEYHSLYLDKIQIESIALEN